MATGRYLTSAWRTLSSAFTLDPTGERFAFARFRSAGGDEVAATDGGGGGPGHRAVPVSLDHGASELTEMQSNGAAAQRKAAEDSGKEVGELYPPEEHAYGDTESKTDRNRISAWQAGWNVTNAIQVKQQNTSEFAL